MPNSILPAERQVGSTTLTPIITSYDTLKDRIYFMCGMPAVDVEICDEQVYDAIDQSLEWYSKYAGYDEIYLIFSSALYEPGLGLRLDKLFSTSLEMAGKYPSTLESDLSSTTLSALSASYDYDLASYRKVIDVFSVEQGESAGINTLFTLEQAFAQQMYSTIMLGNAGFDIVTWHILKTWIKDRRKVLGLIPYFRFDARTQYLKVIPEPGASSSWNNPVYYGCIGCYVEKPIKDLIRERWVHRYALALSKIIIGHIRTKFGSTVMLGGGTINGADLMRQGELEKDQLEKELMTSYGEVSPIGFYIGPG